MCRKEFDVNNSERRCPDANHIVIHARCIRLDGRGKYCRQMAANGIGLDSSSETR